MNSGGAHVYQHKTRGNITVEKGKSWSCQLGKQPEILQQASSGEQQQAKSLPNGGGAANQAKSRSDGGDGAADP
jgi:hypothetical protein